MRAQAGINCNDRSFPVATTAADRQSTSLDTRQRTAVGHLSQEPSVRRWLPRRGLHGAVIDPDFTVTQSGKDIRDISESTRLQQRERHLFGSICVPCGIACFTRDSFYFVTLPWKSGCGRSTRHLSEITSAKKPTR